MSSSRRSCRNDPDKFCYICREYIFKNQRKAITDFVRKIYLTYFKVKFGDQDKPWALHIVCKAYVQSLEKWTDGTLKSLKFGVPMVWREPKNHFNECYFCLMDLKGFNRPPKKNLKLPQFESGCQPVSHCEEVPVSEFNDLPDLFVEYDKFHEEVGSSASDSGGSVFQSSSSIPEQFKQEELSNLMRDINLSKEAAEIVAFRHKDKNCHKTKASITFYRTRKKNYFHILAKKKNLFTLKISKGFH